MSTTFAYDPAAPLMPWPLFALALLVLVAGVNDLRSHRIPNRLVVLGVGVAVLAAGARGGGSGLLLAGSGLLVGLAVWMPMYLMRTLGAGDVKLMAMVGAFLGPVAVLSASLLTCLAGGVLALAFALHKGALPRLLGNVRDMLCGAAVEMVLTARTTVHAPVASVGRLPYGVAIAAGTLGQIVLQQSGRSLL